ncbi:molybdopterin-synthase adenylyltransferase MoeB [Desulfofundulus thermobenzoicus]|uniref:Molybdopterin-synthase adenylyltransferase MoeB n=1 Tax=Desulfofundulus thermobenzoicus TaxID=29376 RepID=A0A6N7ILA3_9FIRM|nr:HesA/MoeB/ThiF family protein [Desulfofundulus thermobenzoicus]MQL50762.1 molybdopterin-synthase adenylyltransferase MoeB [Desulfofundulus thermobenzoicus]
MKGLTQEQEKRYQRNILLPGVGVEGQVKLLQSGVLLVGAGGLGSPAAFYLAAAGVGRLGLVDADVVDLSNLQRQILHRTGDIGRPKVESARDKLVALNPDVQVEVFPERLSAASAVSLIERYDLVVDCTDNFATRFLLNETCLALGKPFIYGGVLAFAGNLMTIIPGAGPCLRCIFPVEPEQGVPGCAELGVLGAVPGIIGTLQATEAIKYLLGLGELLTGRLLTFDALSMTFYEVSVQQNPDCPACGRYRVHNYGT